MVDTKTTVKEKTPQQIGIMACVITEISSALLDERIDDASYHNWLSELAVIADYHSH